MVGREPLPGVGCTRQAQEVYSLVKDLLEAGSRSQGGSERQEERRQADRDIRSRIVLVASTGRQAEEGSKVVGLQQDSQLGEANMAVRRKDLGHRRLALLALGLCID